MKSSLHYISIKSCITKRSCITHCMHGAGAARAPVCVAYVRITFSCRLLIVVPSLSFEFAVETPMAMMKLYIAAFFTGALTCTLTSANANFKAPAFHHILKSLETKQELLGVGDCSGNYVTQYFFTNVSGELGLRNFLTMWTLMKYGVLEPARKPL